LSLAKEVACNKGLQYIDAMMAQCGDGCIEEA